MSKLHQLPKGFGLRWGWLPVWDVAFFFLFSPNIYLFILCGRRVCSHATAFMWWPEDSFESLHSPPPPWVLGIEPRLSGLAIGTFTH